MSEDNWPSDASIEAYLTEKTDVPNQKWSQRRINGLKEIDNPFLDPNAKKLYDENQLQSNPTINILSTKCSTFDMNDVSEVPNEYTPVRQMIFRSELNDASINKPINPRVDVSCLAAQFSVNPNCFDNLDLDRNLNPIYTPYNWQYLMIDVEDLSVPGTNFEPIVCSVFILDNKNIVSQRWNFFTPYSRTYFDCKVHSQHAAIDISGVSENAYLCVMYYRIFQIDNGDVCNSYYKKPSDSALQKARASIATTISRLKDCWTPFAFSYVPIKSAQGNVDFPSASLPDKQLTGEYIASQIERARGKLDTLPISLKLKAQIKKFSHPNKIDPEFVPIRSIIPEVSQPVFEFRHQLILTLGAAKFDLPSKVNARNIVAQVSFFNGENSIPAIHDHWKGNEIVESSFSRCLYHEKYPIFEDEFIIDLPINPDPNAYIQICYYHAATQEKEQALRMFASSTLPLFEDDVYVKDGNHTIAINYPKISGGKPTPNNCQQIKTFLFSTIASQDVYLNPMFSTKKKIIPAVDYISEPSVVNHLFQILDSLVEGVALTQPKSSVNAMIGLGKLEKEIGLERLEELLLKYVSFYAFRKEETRNVIIHNNIFKYWHDSLTKESPRNDIPVSSFLFSLLLKSIVATKDRNFKEQFFQLFTRMKEVLSSFTQTSLERSKIFNRSFALFISGLTDIGFYELSGQLIIEYTHSFGNTENDYVAMMDFLSNALHPKLFIALTLAHDNFIGFFYDIILKAIETPQSRSLQIIFMIFDRMLLFVPEKNLSDIASKYVNLLEIFTNNEIKIEKEELRYLMSCISFICKYVNQYEFQEFYSKIDHIKFNNLLHTALTKTRITFVRHIDPSVKQESVNEALSFVKNRSRKSIHASFEMSIPITSNVVRDAYISSSLGSSEGQQAPEVRELALDMQISILHVTTHILTIYGPDAPSIVLDMIYHILSANICIDIARQIKEIIFLYIEKGVNSMILSREPPFPLFLMKLLSLMSAKNSAVAEELVSILPRLFAAELRIYPTNNRSHVAAIRAISKMRDEDLESPILLKALQSRSDNGGNIDKMIDCIQKITEINIDMRLIDPEHFRELRSAQVVKEASKNETNIEKYGDDLLLRSKAYAASPDACAEEISYLVQYHHRNKYISEEMMAQIYLIALIVEYLTVLKHIPNAYHMDHPALVFKDTCNSVVDHICPEFIMKDIPDIPGYCDSPMFTDAGIFTILQELHSTCKAASLFEISNEVKILTYPLLEQRNMHLELAQQFMKSMMSYMVMKTMSSNMDRMLGKYYRVAFYGKIFGSDDGKMFVQRETKLTHLFDVTNRIKNTYINLFGPDKIEIITISGFVDRKLLDPEKGYIQLTFVEPFFEKKEMEKRVTVFECGSKLGMFKFETPFVKGEKKLQGSVETQWQRRTILKVKAVMPAITKRVEVPPEGFIVVEYEPIRVSIRQIKERIQQYEAALAKQDHQAIQPLLHGSLLVQVNEGPTKMAEVFLGSNLRTKYTEKMRRLFQTFLELNAQGLAIHGAFVRLNPGFQELQNQLEEGFKNLTAKLSPYLNPPNK
ncbi:Dedicator of cytokinesis family protein [Tritrichomonas foetus]|uniref:Dedicator of cytokinesis family protein n=1 Tax=Tritrichomonas foetus TaxID=1144522 RepID=A0A1J4K055_9EUKA|nr:Dedicator of cytokinesis family protein [Tritrichomonas foetus]|eukprot:OHT04801.1 Dedicator of cytokinesis family protein [Tritrichomonas foetus]